MSKITPRPPVEPDARRAMTPARMRRIWEREKGVCWMCGQAVPMRGPGVRYDHKLPLELNGPDTDDNVFPLHTLPCDALKYKADRARIDKMRRQAKMATKQPEGRLKSRGFPQDGPKRKLPSRPFPSRRKNDP